MRRILLATLIASFVTGCGTTPTMRAVPKSSKPAVSARAAAPVVRTIPGFKGPAPTVSVTAAVAASAAKVAASELAVEEVILADAQLDSIELLIQDGGAYFVQGWWSDLKDWAKRTWTRFKLSLQVKAALKHNREEAFELHEGQIDTIRKNRTAPVTKVVAIEDGKEIIQTWKSTDKGAFEVETHRVIDDDGVTQILEVSTKGTDSKGVGIDLVRIRTLVGEDGTYKVATKQTTTGKDGREEYQEWLKTVSVDGTEKIEGYIVHRDGYRTDITGTRDAKGKVKIEVSKISPGHADR